MSSASEDPRPPERAGSVLGTGSPAEFRSAVARAADLLRAGGIVAVPTETVYGLAADARNVAAVGKIFAAKGRPAHNPIIVHAAGLEMARSCVAAWPAEADRLARAFWPGPLTLVLPRAEMIPDVVTAGGPTVGIRWPSHPFMQALLRECGFPLAAPSANLANQLSPTTAGHVWRGLGTAVPLIVDGGACPVGLESTVLDLTVEPPRVLRPGMVSAASLSAVLGRVGGASGLAAVPSDQVPGRARLLPSRDKVEGTRARQQPRPTRDDRSRETPTGMAPSPAARSPGLLPRHYAPHARLLVLAWESAADLQAKLQRAGARAAAVFVIAHTHIPSAAGFGGVSVIPHDPEAFARALYAELHRCDEAGAEWIVMEAVPDEPGWEAAADRLRRAVA